MFKSRHFKSLFIGISTSYLYNQVVGKYNNIENNTDNKINQGWNGLDQLIKTNLYMLALNP